ncbi:MAG: outer membrane protein assembly factor BamA [Candidatus Abyssobacteria bacterium SURF_17]|uniref:Outer membrane protein assembly factor BamA n=1 Tax=Candidatus Abyssobacteria bacterium SURF_17 TaxID=2093361 RepID=A0A419F7X7_9BACT|nr:MAG: outer membrane protein assembly factor BamA [Candidatus Abyssubacteria bacterium SURF_17]
MPFLLLFLLPSHGVAQSEEGLPVISVQIEGNRLVSAQLIRAQLRVREGNPLSRADVQRDIQRLFSLGYFSDIKVDVARQDDGVAVTYIVAERKIIREVLILGNKKVKEEDLRAVLSLRRGDTYIPKTIDKDVLAIREVYRGKGYSEVTVNASYREISPTEVEVVYEILEGKKARVREIIIEGNTALTDKAIRKGMQTKARFLWFGGFFDEKIFKEDLDRIEDMYADHGYIDAQVTDAQVEFFAEGERVRLQIFVAEGDQYFIDSVAVDGNTVFDDTRLLQIVKSETGTYYNRSQVEREALAIQDFYSDQGYILANVRPRPAIDRDAKEVQVTYQVSERDLIYVAKVDIEGNVKTKDAVIRRELTIVPGERFDGSKIRRSRQKLLNTQYFKDVYIDTEPTDEQRYRNLIFEVEEQKTGTFNFGAGYSSNDALIGQIQITQNNFDLFNPPTFTGAGQKFQVALRPGTILSEYQLSITEPYFMGYPFAAGFDLYFIDREYDDYDQQNVGAGLRVGKRITDFSSLGLSYNFSEYDISNVDDDAPQTIKDEEGTRTKSSMALNFTNDTRDSYLDPTAGHRYTSSLELAGGPLGAETDVVKLVGEARWYRPLGDKFVLLTRLEAGVAEEYGDSDFVPLFDRFFAGGSNSVRGYDYRDVGPREDDDPIGGKTKFEGTLELSYPLIDIIKGYGFFDFGQVWREIDDFGQGKINTSVGLGVGLRTPIGPIRLDYGFPLNPNDDQGSGRIHFTTGLSF